MNARRAKEALVSAELRIDRPAIQQGGKEFEASEKTTETYRQTQGRMVKSVFVLNAVLRKPEIAELQVLANEVHPLEWLERNIEVDFPATEFIRVSFVGARSPDAVTLVNAVVDEFLKAANAQLIDREKRIAEIDRWQRETNDRQRALSTHLLRLAKSLHTSDPAVLSNWHQFDLEDQGQLRKERFRAHLDLTGNRIRLEALERAARESAAAPDSDAKIEREVERDGVIVGYLVRKGILDELVAQDESPKEVEAQRELGKIKRELAAIDKPLAARRDALRPQIADQLRTAEKERRQSEISELATAIKVDEARLEQLDAELAERKTVSERTGIYVSELEIIRRDLEALDAPRQRAVDERQKLKGQIETMHRIILHRAAQ
ncbi:MAG TPA: hypothetical protein VKU82_15385 [Planctomycetaceae bacterium]|nr:hypothetical protein [Planctomycetaceae bacterium]